MALVVQKYGGSSVATPEHIQRVAQRIVEEKRRGHKMVVVVSALGETTDHLVQMASQISRKPPEREMDMLLSVGERISIALLAMAVHELGFEAISFTGSQIGIITDTRHTQARVLEVKATRLLDELEKGRIVIVAGFQGVSINKEITTLGRGGSDTTAIALAAALRADRCEIMKDVNGIYVAEPKLIPDVRLIQEISYDEMLEMANVGAGVLKTESIEIAKAHKIKIGVGSSVSGEIGTIVTDRSLDSSRISGIVGQKGVAVISLATENEQLKNLVNRTLAQDGVNILSYISSLNGLHFAFNNTMIDKVQNLMSDVFSSLNPAHIKIENNLGLIAIVGAGLNFNSNTAYNLFKVLEEFKTALRMLQITPLRVSWILPEEETDHMVKRLYRELKVNHSHQ